MKLYSYWRSSTAYRVRIALAIKGIPFEYVPVSLVANGGMHLEPEYEARNPQKLVPLLELDDGRYISQSLAIIEYLDEVTPHPPLLPKDAELRAQARSIALAVACDIHPLANLRVMNYLKDTLQVADSARTAWYHHWITEGFAAIEKLLERYDTPYALGDSPTLADIALVPQVYNARRFSIHLENFPRITSIAELCSKLDSFRTAEPERQPDAIG
jgi:maleylacetoacetate isomerase